MLVTIALLGSLLAAAGTIPYVIDTVKGNTKPRLVTWLTWSLLTGLAAAAALADGKVLSGIFAGLGCAATGSIVVIGFRYGDRSFKALDIACMAGVLVGLALWLAFNSPLFAVWAAIIIDLVGFVPTLVHAYAKPYEETPSAFAMVGAGGALASVAIIAGGSLGVTAIGYPLYVAVSMAVCTLVVVLRRKLVPRPAAVALQEAQG